MTEAQRIFDTLGYDHLRSGREQRDDAALDWAECHFHGIERSLSVAIMGEKGSMHCDQFITDEDRRNHHRVLVLARTRVLPEREPQHARQRAVIAASLPQIRSDKA